MPKSAKYLENFGLHKGLKLEGYELERISAGHIVMRRYKEYQYPTEIIWKRINSNATPEKLVSSLSRYLGNNKTIYTAYSNAYDCNFGTLKLRNHGDGKLVHIEATGRCVRV
uniref:Uncharacterized protein n=1 Tax=Pithovirus LCPAC403 TaxID=2506596 RepID=A0A481ZAJ4_9VIRU|nr:MAG: uncharacterized protein LCPAC403_00770 [Pithovirus LCPAC403]